jgi:hypothetical protein
MNQQNYQCSITANITVEDAIEKINRVSAWWTKSCEGNSQKTGDTFAVHFGETFVDFKITEAIPNKRIVWDVIDCNLHWLEDKKEWKGTKMEWGISSNGNATQINFTHIGLVPEIECYGDCVKGWNFYIKESLFKLITEGKGLPETPKNARNSTVEY